MLLSIPALTWGKARTFTVSIWKLPVQSVGAGPLGVRTYDTSISLLVVLIRVSLMLAVDPEDAELLMPETKALDHVKVEFDRLLVIV